MCIIGSAIFTVCLSLQYIENLSELKSLEQLNISGNAVEKIQNLEHLSNLQELNLSKNRICRIEGLGSLSKLQILNLNGNLITSIPAWLGEKLKNLKSLAVAGNRISGVSVSTLCFLSPSIFLFWPWAV